MLHTRQWTTFQSPADHSIDTYLEQIWLQIPCSTHIFTFEPPIGRRKTHTHTTAGARKCDQQTQMAQYGRVLISTNICNTPKLPKGTRASRKELCKIRKHGPAVSSAVRQTAGFLGHLSKTTGEQSIELLYKFY